jgi:hypothetical protein
MRHHKHSIRAGKPRPTAPNDHSVKAGKPSPTASAQRKFDHVARVKSPPRRWSIVALCVIVAGVGTWALFEFVVWNRLPPELVGKWVVEGGPQDGATFDFFRSGAMEAHVNLQGREGIVKASVAVDGKALLMTTRNPNTGQDETRRSIIRELTARTLVLEDEKGDVYRMVPAR